MMDYTTACDQALGELGSPNGGCAFCPGIEAHMRYCVRVKARVRNIQWEDRRQDA
jgi:hypothetical protein